MSPVQYLDRLSPLLRDRTLVSELRVLAVAAGRGGTGKSTLAFALADALRTAVPGVSVALVDLDPQAGLTGYAKAAPSADPVRDAPVEVHGLTLYRGGRALAHASDADVSAHLERALSGTNDRVLVVDMAPALTDAAHRAVFARDDVMLIGAIKTEPGSFQSMNELVAYVSRRNLPYILVPTIHRNVLLNNTMLLTMRQQHEGHVADVLVPLDGKAAECVVAGQPVTTYARRSKAAQAITALVREIFGEVAEPEPAPPTRTRRRTSTSAVTAPTAAPPAAATPAAAAPTTRRSTNTRRTTR